MYSPAKFTLCTAPLCTVRQNAVGPFRVPTAYQSHLNMISLLHPGPGPDCPLTQMRGLELMSTLAFHPARGQTWVTMELSRPVKTGTKVIEVAKATTWHALGDTEFIIANHLE